MAFETFGPENCETLVPLALQYSRQVVKPPAGTATTATIFRYSRYATKTYCFKGMSEAAVKRCLSEKRRQYMRRFVAWSWSGASRVRGSLTDDYYEQVATFNVSKREVVYDLTITVDETVFVYSTKDFSPLTEEGCGYIEGLFQAMAIQPESWVSTYKYDEPEED